MSDAQEIEQPGEMDMLGDSSALEGLEMALLPRMEECRSQLSRLPARKVGAAPPI